MSVRRGLLAQCLQPWGEAASSSSGGGNSSSCCSSAAAAAASLHTSASADSAAAAASASASALAQQQQQQHHPDAGAPSLESLHERVLETVRREQARAGRSRKAAFARMWQPPTKAAAAAAAAAASRRSEHAAADAAPWHAVADPSQLRDSVVADAAGSADLTAADVGLYYPFDAARVPEAFAPFHQAFYPPRPQHLQRRGGCRGLQAEFAATGTRHLMWRDALQRLAERLDAALTQPEGGGSGGAAARLLLRGARGSGKSVALAALVERARARGEVAIYVPDAAGLVRGGFFEKRQEDGTYDTIIAAQHVLKSAADCHADQLAALPLRGPMPRGGAGGGGGGDKQQQRQQASGEAALEAGGSGGGGATLLDLAMAGLSTDDDVRATTEGGRGSAHTRGRRARAHHPHSERFRSGTTTCQQPHATPQNIPSPELAGAPRRRVRARARARARRLGRAVPRRDRRLRRAARPDRLRHDSHAPRAGPRGGAAQRRPRGAVAAAAARRGAQPGAFLRRWVQP